MLFEDGYDGDALDYQQLKQDNINHKLTSIGNLRGFTSAMAATPVDRKERRRMMKDPTIPARNMFYRKANTRGKEQVQDCIDWLNLNAHELPSELDNEDGTSKQSSRVLVNVGTVQDRAADQAIADASQEDDRVGLYYCEGTDALNPRSSAWTALVHSSAADKELRELLLSAGFGTEAVQNLLADVKSEAYQKYAIKRAKELRWRGMQEFNGVTRAIECESEGVKLAPAQSGAKALPSQERLNELLSYDRVTGSLTHAKTRSGVKAGSQAFYVRKDGKLQTRVDGVKHYTSRVVWMMEYGTDPAGATIEYVDGDPSNLRLDNLALETTVQAVTDAVGLERERIEFESKYRAVVAVRGKRMLIGDFRHQEEAAEARKLFIKTMRRT